MQVSLVSIQLRTYSGGLPVYQYRAAGVQKNVSLEELATIDTHTKFSFRGADLIPLKRNFDFKKNTPEWNSSSTREFLTLLEEFLALNSTADYYIVLTPITQSNDIHSNKLFEEELLKNFFMKSPRVIPR